MAFPVPTPTEPFLSPITIATLKLNLLPPDTTRVTLLIFKIFCSNSFFYPFSSNKFARIFFKEDLCVPSVLLLFSFYQQQEQLFHFYFQRFLLPAQAGLFLYQILFYFFFHIKYIKKLIHLLSHYQQLL